jgi:hypothetical protein
MADGSGASVPWLTGSHLDHEMDVDVLMMSR